MSGVIVATIIKSTSSDAIFASSSARSAAIAAISEVDCSAVAMRRSLIPVRV